MSPCCVSFQFFIGISHSFSRCQLFIASWQPRSWCIGQWGIFLLPINSPCCSSSHAVSFHSTTVMDRSLSAVMNTLFATSVSAKLDLFSITIHLAEKLNVMSNTRPLYPRKGAQTSWWLPIDFAKPLPQIHSFLSIRYKAQETFPRCVWKMHVWQQISSKLRGGLFLTFPKAKSPRGKVSDMIRRRPTTMTLFAPRMDARNKQHCLDKTAEYELLSMYDMCGSNPRWV